MKKIYIILMLITTILLADANEKGLKIPDKNAPSWWYELTEQEQWDYFRQMAIEYVRLDKIAKEQLELTDELNNRLNDSNEFLKKYNPYFPKNGLGLNLLLLLDSSLTFDAVFNFCYRKYFLRGRLFIAPGISLKYYKRVLTKDQGFGGGVNFGIGLTF